MTYKSFVAGMFTAMLAIGLIGCQSATPTLALADACNSFANALDQLTPIKAKLSTATIGAVNNAVALTQPLCSSGTAPTDVASAISLVSGEASAILAIVAGNK